MKNSFEKLDPKKQTNILNAAYLEFTKKGYDEASTNEIVKQAGIGKGTLFYYFDSKLELFKYLLEEATEIALDEYLYKIDYDETDIFKRLIELGDLKARAFSQFEIPINFIMNILLKVDEYAFVAPKLSNTRKKFEEYVTAILKRNIDYSKFKEGISGPKAVELIHWSIEGYRAKLEQSVKGKESNHFSIPEIEAYYEEFYEYLYILQKAYYKEEYVETAYIDLNIGGKK